MRRIDGAPAVGYEARIAPSWCNWWGWSSFYSSMCSLQESCGTHIANIPSRDEEIEFEECRIVNTQARSLPIDVFYYGFNFSSASFLKFILMDILCIYIPNVTPFFPSPYPLPLLWRCSQSLPSTPTSTHWHYPTLEKWVFIGPRSSSPIDARQMLSSATYTAGAMGPSICTLWLVVWSLGALGNQIGWYCLSFLWGIVLFFNIPVLGTWPCSFKTASSDYLLWSLKCFCDI